MVHVLALLPALTAPPEKVRLPVPAAPKMAVWEIVTALVKVRAVPSVERMRAVVALFIFSAPVPNALSWPACKVPPVMVTPLEKVLLPLRTQVPVSSLITRTRPPSPVLSAMTPEMVLSPAFAPRRVRERPAFATGVLPGRLKAALEKVSVSAVVLPEAVMVELPRSSALAPLPMFTCRLMLTPEPALPVNSRTPLLFVWPRRIAPVPSPKLLSALKERVPSLTKMFQVSLAPVVLSALRMAIDPPFTTSAPVAAVAAWRLRLPIFPFTSQVPLPVKIKLAWWSLPRLIVTFSSIVAVLVELLAK